MYSTINVQHLESVSRRITESTGIVIPETIPDGIVDEADELVVVDLTPEALRERITEGKVFPAGSVPVALQRFFTKEHLDVLREIALLQVVEEVEAHRLAADVLDHQDRLLSNAAAEHEHRFLGLVTPDPSANRIVRRAWEMSERIGGKLDLLWVAPAHRNDDPDADRNLRRDFPWRRVPGYIIVQLIGATLAALVLHAVINASAVHGSNYVASGYSAGAGFWMELLLTFGLVSVILGTASGAQNIGIIAALGVGAYIALAGLWGSPISGASMNPARTFGPDLMGESSPTTGSISPGRSWVAP